MRTMYMILLADLDIKNKPAAPAPHEIKPARSTFHRSSHLLLRSPFPLRQGPWSRRRGRRAREGRDEVRLAAAAAGKPGEGSFGGESGVDGFHSDHWCIWPAPKASGRAERRPQKWTLRFKRREWIIGLSESRDLPRPNPSTRRETRGRPLKRPNALRNYAHVRGVGTGNLTSHSAKIDRSKCRTTDKTRVTISCRKF